MRYGDTDIVRRVKLVIAEINRISCQILPAYKYLKSTRCVNDTHQYFDQENLRSIFVIEEMV